jgi:YidC/Oxa1 family membrane protein insertase
MRSYGRKIQKIKPKVVDLQRRFANNPRKLREEQMKLYREHGIGFPMGCLMLLIQIPIFFALFSCLRAEYTLRNSAFVWIPDLSGPDRLFDLGFSFEIPLIGAAMGPISSLNLLPILYLVLTFWQQRMMPKPMDEQQAQQMKMMKWLPIFFAVLLYNYTAALALYMIVSSLVAVAESKVVKRLDERALEAAAAGPA